MGGECVAFRDNSSKKREKASPRVNQKRDYVRSKEN